MGLRRTVSRGRFDPPPQILSGEECEHHSREPSTPVASRRASLQAANRASGDEEPRDRGIVAIESPSVTVDPDAAHCECDAGDDRYGYVRRRTYGTERAGAVGINRRATLNKEISGCDRLG